MRQVTNTELLEKIDLVVSKLMAFGDTNLNKDASTDSGDHAKGIIARDFGIKEWDWPQGVGLYGLNKLQGFLNNNQYDDFLKQWFSDNMTLGLPSKNINTTAPFLTLLDYGLRVDNKEYLDMCIERANWLMTELPKTEDGGFQHVTSAIGDRNGITLNADQLWVDTLFMAVLFLNKMGHIYKRMDWIGEANKQLLVHIKYLYDTKSCLFYHGWTFQNRSNFGGIFWCRGNSWFTFGLLEFLETSKDSMEIGLKEYLVDTFKSQAKVLKTLQDQSGLWHTVLDDSSSYLEVSGSAAITAGIIKGIKLGILDESYQEVVNKSIQAIMNNIDKEGHVLNVSAGTGMGENAQHYKDIIIAPMAYGQSLGLVALCEALK